MSFLVVGLGSMGKRRIRCLNALHVQNIIGFDIRHDRVEETKKLYNIATVKELSEVDFRQIEAIVISTPPDRHLEYIILALKHNKPCFVEASVISKGLNKVNIAAKSKKLLVAPSCTMLFHQAIKNIQRIVREQRFGKVSNFSYHCGQYLPDWHPWEKVTDFYVSQKETGGAREIVPFELTWLVDVFGFPKNIKGYMNKTINVGADIYDSYAIALEYKAAVGAMIIDVTSRFATRSLILNMEKGQLIWNWEDSFIKIYDSKDRKWITMNHKKGKANVLYNKNISETMYIDEITAFLAAIKSNAKFPNNLDNDIKVLNLLNRVESKH